MRILDDENESTFRHSYRESERYRAAGVHAGHMVSSASPRFVMHFSFESIFVSLCGVDNGQGEKHNIFVSHKEEHDNCSALSFFPSTETKIPEVQSQQQAQKSIHNV